MKEMMTFYMTYKEESFYFRLSFGKGAMLIMLCLLDRIISYLLRLECNFVQYKILSSIVLIIIWRVETWDDGTEQNEYLCVLSAIYRERTWSFL